MTRLNQSPFTAKALLAVAGSSRQFELDSPFELLLDGRDFIIVAGREIVPMEVGVPLAELSIVPQPIGKPQRVAVGGKKKCPGCGHLVTIGPRGGKCSRVMCGVHINASS